MGSQFDEHCCNNCEGWPLSYRRNIKTKDFDKIMAAIKITAFGMRSNATPIFDSYHPPPSTSPENTMFDPHFYLPT